MLGTMIPPFYNASGGSIPPATNTTTTAFTGDGWTFTKTAQAGTAETPIVAFGVSDGSGSLIVENASATDAIYSPRLRGVGQTTGSSLTLMAQGVTDTGTNGVMQLISRIGTSTLVTTRPLLTILNHSTEVASVSAKGVWTYTIAHTDATADDMAYWKLDEDTSSSASILNGSSTNAILCPMFRGINSGVQIACILQGRGTTDTGTNAVTRIDTRIGTGTAVATRPNISFTNAAVEYAQFGPTGVLQINGGSAPGLKVGNTNVGIKQLFTASGTINPASVAANTTSTQSFTVTGVTSNDMAIVLNTSALPAGLGIVDVFPSGVDTIDVTFMNNTGVAIDSGAVSYILSGFQFI